MRPSASTSLTLLLGLAMSSCFGGGKGAGSSAEHGVHRSALSWDGSDMSCPAYNAGIFGTDLAGSGATSTAGTIAGHFEVTDAGAASYAMTLEVPPGRAGMQPDVRIEYSSDLGNGVLGVGFRLSGVSQIARCARNVSEDHVLSPVLLQPDDRLCLDGQRLINVNGGGYGALGTEYRTVPDSFTKIVSMPSTSDTHNPAAQWFRVFTKDGRISDYGTSTGSTPPLGSAIRTTWNREKVADRSGNSMIYRFGTVTQNSTRSPAIVEQWLDSIDYTAHDNPSLPAQRRVQFRYLTNRPDPLHGYDLGTPTQTTRRLFEIWMLGPSGSGPFTNLIRQYELVYRVGSASGRSRLTSLQECVGTTTRPICKTPTRFGWNGAGGSAANPSVLGFTRTMTAAYASVTFWRDRIPFTTGDFDGDGREDLLYQDYGVPDTESHAWAFSLATTTPLAPADPILQRTSSYPRGSVVGIDTNSFEEVMPLDYDQDGLTDLFVVAHSGNYLVLRSNGSNFSQVIDTGIPSVPVPSAVRLIDFTGDGAPDLVECSDGSGFYVRPWRPAARNHDAGFGPRVRLGTATNCQVPSAFISMDVNGDGAADIFLPDGPNGKYNIYFGNDNPTPKNITSIDSGIAHGVVTETPSRAHKVLDINGDGYDDLLYTNGVRTDLYVNTGSWAGLNPLRFKGPLDAHPGGFNVGGRELGTATIIDVDGDGRDDVMLGAPLGFLFSRGEQLQAAAVSGLPQNTDLRRVSINGNPNGALLGVLLPLEPSIDTPKFFLLRNNVDSPDVVISVTDGLSGQNTNASSNSNRVDIVYEPLIHEVTATPDIDFYHRNELSNCVYPSRCVAGTKRVVRQYHVDTGQGPNNVVQGHFVETYRDARFDRLGRGWLGFGKRTDYHLTVRNKVATADRAKRYYVDYLTYDGNHMRYPHLGAHLRETAVVGNVTSKNSKCEVSSTFNKGWSTFGDSFNGAPGGDGPTYFDYVYEKEDSFSENIPCLDDVPASTVNLTRNTIFLNQFGDPDTVMKQNDDSFPISMDISITYDPNGWIVPITRRTTNCSTEPNQDLLCRQTQELFDGATGLPTSTVIEPDDPSHRLELTYFHDQYGHITGQQQTGVSDAWGTQSTRLACTSFETNEYIFPFAHQQGAVNFSIVTSYEKYDAARGVRTQQIDPNGLVTASAYDDFGNLTKQKLPDGTTSTVATTVVRDGALDKSDLAVHVHTTSTSGDDREIQLDTLGRVQRAWHFVAGPSGGAPRRVVQQTKYDEFGRAVGQSIPAFDTGAALQYVTFAFDGWDRLLSRQAVDGTTTKYAYAGRGTDITEASATSAARTTHLQTDGLGRMIWTTDANGQSTRYRQGPFGTVTGVSEPGSGLWDTAIVPDAYGRPVAISDPDLGLITRQYDAFGEPVQSVDANQRSLGAQTVQYYDGFGRLVLRNDQDGNTAIAYDTSPGAGIGQLSYTQSPGGWLVYHTYDSVGRPIRTRTWAPDGQFYDVGRTYDATTGRLSQLDYPVWSTGTEPDTDGDGVPDGHRFAVQLGYDAKGNLTKIWDAYSDPARRTYYWQQIEADPVGRNFRELLGDGAITERTFDDTADGVLKKIVTQKVNSTYQDLAYTYDRLRRLTRRQDNRQSNVQEGFCYDKLDRLTGSVLGTSDPCGGANLKYKYDPNGNLTFKADMSASGFAYDAQHPHAVQLAGPFQFLYDAKGNQIMSQSGATRTDVAYTAADKPRQFRQGDNVVASLEYDAVGNRMRKQTRDASTVYVGDLFEKVSHSDPSGTVDYRYLIHSPERTVAIDTLHVTLSPGRFSNEEVRYLRVDHLGSVDVVTDPSANVVERRSYDAFGKARNPNWTASGGASGGAAVPQDYTGHEFDPELGLVNMKGRLYNPTIGRFISADPLVPNPRNGQHWNRYSYVYNSPLNLIDPSGFDDQAPAPPPPPPPAPPPAPPPVSPGQLRQMIHAPKTGMIARGECASGTECMAVLRARTHPEPITDKQTTPADSTSVPGPGGTKPGAPEAKGHAPGYGSDAGRNPGGPGPSNGAGGATTPPSGAGAQGGGGMGRYERQVIAPGQCYVDKIHWLNAQDNYFRNRAEARYRDDAELQFERDHATGPSLWQDDDTGPMLEHDKWVDESKETLRQLVETTFAPAAGFIPDPERQKEYLQFVNNAWAGPMEVHGSKLSEESRVPEVHPAPQTGKTDPWHNPYPTK